MGIWVMPRRRQGIVKHEGRGIEPESMRSKVRLILLLIPCPPQPQSPPSHYVMVVTASDQSQYLPVRCGSSDELKVGPLRDTGSWYCFKLDLMAPGLFLDAFERDCRGSPLWGRDDEAEGHSRPLGSPGSDQSAWLRRSAALRFAGHTAGEPGIPEAAESLMVPWRPVW